MSRSGEIKPSQAAALLLPKRNLDRASIYDNLANADALISVVELDLSVAQDVTKPYEVGFPFLSVYVEDATDTGTTVNMKVNSRGTAQGAVSLTRKDSLEFDRPVAKAFLSWDAQASKTMRIVFFLESRFRTGSLISQNSGGVAINEGSIAGATTRLQVVGAAAAVELLPQNFDRNIAVIENASGGPIYISGAGTVTDSGATRGLRINPGDFYEWRNTAALFVYATANADVHYMEQE